MENFIRKCSNFVRLPSKLSTIIYILFAPILLFVEEVIFASEDYTNTRKMQTMEEMYKDKKKSYEDLSEEEKNFLAQFYESVDNKNNRKMMMMTRESSIQFCYQKSLLFYQFIYHPMRELYYGDFRSPTAKWIGLIILQIISICASANSTFSPIIAYKKFKSFEEKSEKLFINEHGDKNLDKSFSDEEKKSLNSLTGLFCYLSGLFLVFFHILFATGALYLLRVDNNDAS